MRKTLISTDAAYYKQCLDRLKPSDRPQTTQIQTDLGCPYDCGLCPGHEQHSCLAIIEVNDHCNLTCPECFANSVPSRDGTRTLAEVERMPDALVASEGEPDLVQISGGEPTLHPQILDILRLAKSKPIRHLMINTNGIRIARDKVFAAELATLKPNFEVCLQFDSLRPAALHTLRGADLTRIRPQALENLAEHNISTTLVATIKKGAIDDEVGSLIQHARTWPNVRGITFQPIQDAGRNEDFNRKTSRTLLSDIRRSVIEADNPFAAHDMIPLPCNPDSIRIGYGLRKGTQITPVTGMIPRETRADALPNTVTFERYPDLRRRLFDFFNLSNTPANAPERLEAFLCCLPDVQLPQTIGYADLFRVVICEFLDPHNFCISRVKRSCVHFVTPAGQIIPFDTYNLFYRDPKARARRVASRRALAAQFREEA